MVASPTGSVPPSPRIAVRPSGTREWVCDAVRAGGGELVAPAEAQALMWTDHGPETGASGGGPEGLARILQEHKALEWVQLPWAGIEPYADVVDHERIWTAGKGVYALPVAEHALALALAGLRDLKRRSLAHSWGEQAGYSLQGGRVTIFGGGGIALELIRLLQPFNCEISVVRKHAEPIPGVTHVYSFTERFEALHGADLVVLALALTPETRGFFGEIELELMEPHAWLVNVARGEHVVTEDLVIALREDVIGGAALDVTDPEPLDEGHPLWELPNCIITPHTANTEDMAIPLLSERISENIRRFADGRELLGVVDVKLGY